MNEFIIREGFISNGLIVTGSLTAYTVTGSVATASYAATSSYSIISATASLVTAITSASYSSYAVSASYSNTSNKLTNYTLGTYKPTNVTTSYSASSGDIGYIFSTVNFMTSPGTLTTANRNSYLNSMVLSPIVAPITGTVSKMMVFGQSVGLGATGSVRLGIYSNSNSMLPSDLILDAGIVNILGTRMGYETSTIPSGPVLTQGETYWLSMLLVGPGNNQGSYLTFLQATLANLYPQNRIFNPLLGVAAPSADLSIRNIVNYRYYLSNTSSLPSTLPQSATSYTASAYGVIDAAAPSGPATTIPMGPGVYIIS